MSNSTSESCSCDNSIPYRQLRPVPSGTTWDGLTGFSFSSTGTAFGSPLYSVTMSWFDSDGSEVLTITEASGITITSASGWTFDIEGRLMMLSAGSYYWKIKTTDSDGIVKIRLQGGIDIL